MSSSGIKNNSLYRNLNLGYIEFIPSHSEGRIAIVTDVGWDAVDADVAH